MCHGARVPLPGASVWAPLNHAHTSDASSPTDANGQAVVACLGGGCPSSDAPCGRTWWNTALEIETEEEAFRGLALTG